jgi:imidazolonepropionase-like amidohydrolase
MAANGVALVPTDIDSLSIIRYITLQSGSPPAAAMVTNYLAGGRARLMRAIEAGVTIAAGSDNYLDLDMPQGQAAKHNLFSYRAAGMAAAEVLRAATLNNGKLLGLEGRLGVLKAGAFADLIAVDGDPVGGGFDALDRVTFVMRSGTVYARP